MIGLQSNLWPFKKIEFLRNSHCMGCGYPFHRFQNLHFEHIELYSSLPVTGVEALERDSLAQLSGDILKSEAREILGEWTYSFVDM